MKRRRGRHRKAGPRTAAGRRVKPAVSPREIAATMPHRRGLGEKATDQLAATVLGRLVLRGDLDATQGQAGELYLAQWRAYVWTLAGPRELAQGGGHGYACDGCAEMRHCRCWFRRQVWQETRTALLRIGGYRVHAVVTAVVLGDEVLREPPDWLVALRIGLQVLAAHFGLTARGKISYQNAASETLRTPAR